MRANHIAWAGILLLGAASALAQSDGAKGDPVETLKASLGTAMGFEVENVKTGDDGVACITYRIDNDLGGETRAHAVVDGDKVMRSTSRSPSFAKAWNRKCASQDSESTES
jgi:hypothetical protein